MTRFHTMSADKNGNNAADSCPVCDSNRLLPCIEITEVPVQCNAVWASRGQALEAPVGSISLVYCTDCGHLFNSTFKPHLMEYTESYENSLHFSPSFQRYAKSLAEGLIERYGVRDKTVIEIGCGKGEFLTLISELGNNRGVGFDPSYVPHPANNSDSSHSLKFIQDVYSDRYAHFQADLVCCRHVLEHVHQPLDFLNGVRRAFTDDSGTVVFFEVPNALATLRQLAIWDIIYEHCSYFTRYSLLHAFKRCGFEVRRVDVAFGAQFLQIESVPGDYPGHEEPNERHELKRLADDVLAFAETFRSKVEEWRGVLKRAEVDSKRIVIWGAGSKGVSFLNALEVSDQIPFVVDVNPRKQGMFVSRTGQEIVPPEFLQDYRPDLVIVMNGLYEDEIRQSTKNLGLEPDFICA